MAKVLFFYDVTGFIASLGVYQVDVLADFSFLSQVGLNALDSVQDLGGGIWEYRRQIAPSRYAYLLFAHYLGCDSYVVLHGFRAGPEGTSRFDLRYARRRRKAQ